MLRWNDNLLWYDNHILASVVRFGPEYVYLDLLGWEGFGLCEYNYATVPAAKTAAESWARSSGIAAAKAGRPGEGAEPVTNDDIPF